MIAQIVLILAHVLAVKTVLSMKEISVKFVLYLIVRNVLMETNVTPVFMEILQQKTKLNVCIVHH